MKEMLYAVRCLKDFKLNCPASARIISSFDFKHRTAYNISFNRYIVATFSTFLLIPVCLLIIIYGTITVSLKRGQLERMKMCKPKRSRDHKSNRRIIGVSVAILACFAISTGPLFVLNFIKIFHQNISSKYFMVPPEAKTYPAIEFIIGSLELNSLLVLGSFLGRHQSYHVLCFQRKLPSGAQAHCLWPIQSWKHQLFCNQKTDISHKTH